MANQLLTGVPTLNLDLLLGYASDQSIVFRFVDDAQVAYNITDTFVLQIKNTKGSASNLLELTSGDGLTVSANEVTADFLVADTTIDREFCFWRLRNTTTNQDWYAGNARFNKGQVPAAVYTITQTIDIGEQVITATISIISDGRIPIAAFTQALKFNKDKELAFTEGGALSFTLSATENLNGMGIILKLNLPTSVVFSADFIALPNSQDFDDTKMNIVTLVYFSDYDGAGNAKVLYNNIQMTAV